MSHDRFPLKDARGFGRRSDHHQRQGYVCLCLNLSYSLDRLAAVASLYHIKGWHKPWQRSASHLRRSYNKTEWPRERPLPYLLPIQQTSRRQSKDLRMRKTVASLNEKHVVPVYSFLLFRNGQCRDDYLHSKALLRQSAPESNRRLLTTPSTAHAVGLVQIRPNIHRLHTSRRLPPLE